MSFLRNEITTSDMFLLVYSGVSKEGLEQRITELLVSWGYKMKGGANGRVIFEKGSRTKRLLLGALVKYFNLSVQVTVSGPDELKCEVRSGTSGLSGGLIGIGQVKREINNLLLAFQKL